MSLNRGARSLISAFLVIASVAVFITVLLGLFAEKAYGVAGFAVVLYIAGVIAGAASRSIDI